MDCVLTLDLGSSSARTLLFSFEGRQIEGFGCQIKYRAHTTEDGGWEIDPVEITEIVAKTIDQICDQMKAKDVKPAAVAMDTFWHSIVGVDRDGKPVTRILHPFDTRSADAAVRLGSRIDNGKQHGRTGCMLHPSYPPPKILWLSEMQPDAFASASRWLSAGEFLFAEFFGEAAASTSMISACGLWDQNENRYDEEMFSVLPVKQEQFADPRKMDQACSKLAAAFAARWPALDGIPWYPALGDGACDNVGSGCASSERWALMVGTSGAMRATFERDRVEIPAGLFCYRIDRRRFVVGGALSNGGEVYAWMKRTLQLPDDAETEKQLASMKPGMHGLTILPLFAGERSTGWRTDTRAVIAGLGSATTPVEILHAAMESVALRFRNVYEIMEQAFGAPKELVGSGGALLKSAIWTRMMADTLGHSVMLCLEREATSRGAALVALERLGAIRNAAEVPANFGDTIAPDPAKKDLYGQALEKQRRLYHHVFEER